MKSTIVYLLLVCVFALKASPADSVQTGEAQGYRIDKPGTITFTVGLKIKGKVEKPQVMIILPKEKTYYREIGFYHSFFDDCMEPMPFVPLTR